MKSNLLRWVNLCLVFVVLMGVVGTPDVVRGQQAALEMGATEQTSSVSGGEDMQSLIDDAWNVEYVGHVGGQSQAVTIQDNFAYMGEGPQLTILDISSPASPVVVGKAPPSSEMILSVTVSAGYAYVSAGYAGMYIVNISNPANPVVVGSYDPPGYVSDVEVYGAYAYVVGGNYGMRVVDVSNPEALVEVSFVPLPFKELAMVASGDYVYGFSDVGGWVVDVSNPADPIVVTTPFGGTYVRSMTISQNFVYVISGSYSIYLDIYDVSTPAVPIWVGGYSVTGVEAGYGYGLTVSDSYAYIADGTSGLRVVDVSDPANPEAVGLLVGMVLGGQDTFLDVAVSGAYGYVASMYGGLRVVGVSNPSAPVEVGGYNTATVAYGVDVEGGYAYVADYYQGLRVVDVSSPTDPVEVGIDRFQFAAGVDVVGDYAYVANYQLRVVDVSTPTEPVEASTLELSSAIYAGTVTVVGDIAYFGGPNTLLGIANVSNPESPIEISYMYNIVSGNGVAVSGNYAYVAAGYISFPGLEIVDVSNLSDPIPISILQTTDPRDVAISGSFAYVADGESLVVVDVSNPIDPIAIGSCELPGGSTSSVDVSGSYAYVTDNDQGLRVVDISDPYNPVEVGFYNTAGTAAKVVVSGGYIYVADREGGLYILQLTGDGIAYSVSGHVEDGYGYPISGVQISSDSGASTQTDVNGNYILTGLIPGTYTITPSKNNYEFTDPLAVVRVPPDAEGVDFFGEQMEKLPVILVPGYGATANWNCFLYGIFCDIPSTWSWSFPVVAGWYQPLIDAFAEAGTGYTVANHFFTVFYYDLRKPLLDNASELGELIQETKELTSATRVDLIGHSMGGLISRTYVQSDLYNNDVAHLITLGSPHQGVAGLYATWEGGGFYHFCAHNELDPLIETISILYFKYLEDDIGLVPISFIRNNLPSIRDLLYTEDYLYANSDDSLILESDMNQRNIVLAYLNQNLDSLYQRTEVSTFAGYGYETPERFYVYPYSSEDYPNWVDGEPNWNREPEFLSFKGDDTVLASSASLPGSFRYFSNTTHGGLTGSPRVITEILSILGIPDNTTRELVPAQVSTRDAPIMILALHGNVNAVITDPNGLIISQDEITISGAEYISDPDDPFKLILIPNPSEGEFTIELEGAEEGIYALGLLDNFSPPTTLVASLDDLWDSSRSEIAPTMPVTYVLTYTAASTEPPTLIAVTPVIQTPVMVGSTVVVGRALPGQEIDIRDADSEAQLGSGYVDAEGFYQVTLDQPLLRGQRIYPYSENVPGVPVTVFAYLQFLPLAQK